MKKESRKKFKVTYKESSLSEKEKRAKLFEVFDILFSEVPGKETREKCKRQNY